MVYAHQVAPGRAQTNPNDRNSKFETTKIATRQRIGSWSVLVIGDWIFDIIWNLSIVI